MGESKEVILPELPHEMEYFSNAMNLLIKHEDGKDEQEQASQTNFSENELTTRIRLAMEHMNMHLVTGEFLKWLPFSPADYSKNDESARSKFTAWSKAVSAHVEERAKKVRQRGHIKGFNIEANISAMFLILEQLVYEIQADLRRDASFKRTDFATNRLEEKLLPVTQLFLLNVRVMRIDFFFMSFRKMDDLLFQLDTLNSQVLTLITNSDSSRKNEIALMYVIREKINFLFRKTFLAMHAPASYKLEKDDKKILEHLYDPGRYSLDFLFKDFIHVLKYYRNEIKNHDRMPTLNVRVGALQPFEKFDDFHYAIEYFRSKDDYDDEQLISHKLEQLKKIEEIFNETCQLKRDSDNFDDIASVALYTYLRSAILAVSLKQPCFLKVKGGYTEAVKFIHKYCRTGIDMTFYDYKAMALYFKNFCDKHIDSLKSDELVKICASWNDALNNWKRSVDLSFQQNYHPFFLPYNESLFDMFYDPWLGKNKERPVGPEFEIKQSPMFNGIAIKLFIASSYMLPGNVKKQKQEATENSFELLDKQHLLVEKAKREIKQTIEIVSDKAILIAKETAEKHTKEYAEGIAFKTARDMSKESEFKAIQVIALFVTVVAFAGTSLTAAKLELSVRNAALFLGIIGFGLTMFIFILINHLKNIRKQDIERWGKFLKEADFENIERIPEILAAYDKQFKMPLPWKTRFRNKVKRYWDNTGMMYIAMLVFGGLIVGSWFFLTPEYRNASGNVDTSESDSISYQFEGKMKLSPAQKP